MENVERKMSADECGTCNGTGEVCYGSTSYGPCHECSNRLPAEKEQRQGEPQGMVWKPIDTAPKDRTVFLGRSGNTVYMTQYGQHYVKWPHQEGGPTFRDVWNMIESDSISPWNPTHWTEIGEL